MVSKKRNNRRNSLIQIFVYSRRSDYQKVRIIEEMLKKLIKKYKTRLFKIKLYK